MIAGCLLMVFSTLCIETEGDMGDRLNKLDHDIRMLLSGQKATYGIAFKDLKSGHYLFINEKEKMHAASTMKVPVMLRLFDMVEQGELNLKTPVMVRNQFKSMVDGSSFSISDDSDTELYRDIGKEVPLGRLLHLMIVRSSNLATNLLIELADANEVTKLMVRLGAKHTPVLRGVEDLKAYEAGLNNKSTAEDMLTIMFVCGESDRFSFESKSKMLEILRAQEFNDLIPAGLPKDSGAVVAHKTGSISHIHHDAAIIDLPNGIRYGLVVFSRDFEDEREKVVQTIRDISGLIYEFVILTHS